MIARGRRVEPATTPLARPGMSPHWAGSWWAPLLAALAVCAVILLVAVSVAPFAAVMT